MASFSFNGISDLNLAFQKSADVPREVQTEILEAMGEVALKAQKELGESMGVRDPESNTHILDKMVLTKPKITDDSGSISVTFKGTRTDSKHNKVRNAEIAFINEFGKKGQQARQFIKTANEMNGEKIISAGESVFNRWLDSLFKK